MAITATELEMLKILKEKNELISMKELSRKAGFEIGYSYMSCKSLGRQGWIGFFSPSSCRITIKGRRKEVSK